MAPHQPGHENSERKLTMCVGNQDRGKLLVNSFQQNICSVLVKILYTPCSCSDVLSQSSASALLTQQVQTPQDPSSRRVSLSNLCCLLLFQLSGSSRNSLPTWLCRLGFCTWLTPRDIHHHSKQGGKQWETAFPCELFSQKYWHFWITYVLMPSEPAGQQLKWSESDSSILCVAGSQEYTSSTWILCFTWTKLQFDQLCFLQRRDLLVLICSRQQMSWKQMYLSLDQFAGFLGLS